MYLTNINKTQKIMKKMLLTLAVAILAAVPSYAQFGRVLGNSKVQEMANKAVAESVHGTLTKDNIVGTWVYDAPACMFESANATSQLIDAKQAASYEKKLVGAYTKLGLTKGSMKWVFTKEGTFQLTQGDVKLYGKYVVYEKSQTVDLNFETEELEFFYSINCPARVKDGMFSIYLKYDRTDALLDTLFGEKASMSCSLVMDGIYSIYPNFMMGFRCKSAK